MRRFFANFVIIAVISLFPAISSIAQQNSIFQVATMGSLAQGVYDGDFTFGRLKQHGNFGLGTFMELDGELVALDGFYYKINADGKLLKISDNDILSFAQITYFNAIHEIRLPAITGYNELGMFVMRGIANRNIPYAIRIDGDFQSVKIRTLRKQAKPYPPLVKAAEHQEVYDLKNVTGTIIGFWFPGYWDGISVNGLHLHFVNYKRTVGGHVLDVALKNGTVSLMNIHDVQVYMPKTPLFSKANLSATDINQSIAQAEGGAAKVH